MEHATGACPTEGVLAMKDSIEIPQPSRGARWRWASSRGALVGGGVLTAILSVGATSAGASTNGHAQPPPSSSHGKPPSGAARPAAAGKITALSTDAITIATMSKATETITYSSNTTFRTKSGTSTPSALAVGKFISVTGTKSSDGSVSAKSIMFGLTPAPAGGRGPGGRPDKGAPAKMPTTTSG
jgi:hypothetical protein